MVGHRLRHYRVVEQIGAGGMGVFPTVRRTNNWVATVALKFFPPGMVANQRWTTVRLLETLADFVKPAVRHQQGLAAFLRHLGAFGLLLLAIADSSPIPTLAGPDILTAILAARQREPWYYYAGVATLAARGASLDSGTKKIV